MLWVLLAKIYAAVKWFFLPPLPEIPTLDINAPCPACGHRLGKLRCVVPEGSNSVRVEHECQVCKARFYEAPILENPGVRIHGTQVAIS